MRLIDADALGIGFANPELFNNPQRAYGWNDVVEIIGNAPTIDVVPVVHGHWIDGTCGCYKICSKCDQISDFDFDYCPHCGAKMDEVMNNENK